MSYQKKMSPLQPQSKDTTVNRQQLKSHEQKPHQATQKTKKPIVLTLIQIGYTIGKGFPLFFSFLIFYLTLRPAQRTPYALSVPWAILAGIGLAISIGVFIGVKRISTDKARALELVSEFRKHRPAKYVSFGLTDIGFLVTQCSFIFSFAYWADLLAFSLPLLLLVIIVIGWVALPIQSLIFMLGGYATLTTSGDERIVTDMLKETLESCPKLTVWRLSNRLFIVRAVDNVDNVPTLNQWKDDDLGQNHIPSLETTVMTDDDDLS